MIRTRVGLALLAGVLLYGCTPNDWDWMQRQNKYPSDYNQTPLGIGFDTPSKAATLKDETLRKGMLEWFSMRDDYLIKWRKSGPLEDQTKRARNRMSLLKSTLADRATQIVGGGEPLN